jgi:DICT domain-containing protein
MLESTIMRCIGLGSGVVMFRLYFEPVFIEISNTLLHDRIRAELADRGVILTDTPAGTTYRITKP